jgi:hypothetical protein
VEIWIQMDMVDPLAGRLSVIPVLAEVRVGGRERSC